MGCDMAVHALQLSGKVARSCKYTCTKLFFDVKSAYYRAIRELLVRRPGEALDFQKLCERFQLTEEDAEELEKRLEAPSVLEMAGASKHLQSLVSEALDHTWFQMGDQVTETARGTKTRRSTSRLCLLPNFRIGVA